MLVSLYSSKGGAGKTTTAISLIGALAEHNKIGDESAIRVLAIDADRQGTLTAFAQGRADQNKPDYGISFIHRDFNDLTPEMLVELDSEYDVTIIDLPGFYDARGLQLTLVSDVILVPTNLGVSELKEAFNAMNNLTTMKEEIGSSGKHALLLSRVNAIGRMTPKFSKLLFETILDGGYDVLNAKVSDQHGYQAQVDYSEYLFEQASEEASKSATRALNETRHLLKTVMGFELVERGTEKAAIILEELGREK